MPSIAKLVVKVPGKAGTSGGTLPASTDGTFAADSDSLLPTQKATKTYIDGRFDAVNAEVYKGVIDCSSNPNYPAASAGHVYRVSVAGKIGGASGVNVEVNDRLECHTDSSASGNHATVGANWWISQTNIDGAVTGPATSVNNRIAVFSGTTGKAIADGGKTLPTGAVVGDTDAQTLANKSFPDTSTDIIGNGDATKKSGFNNDLVTAGQRRIMTIPDKSGIIVMDPTGVIEIPPTLDLDFRNINGAPFAGNLTRATAGGYRQNSKGVLVPTVVNEPVIDFSAGTALGTGFYGAFTNLLLRSEEFDNAAWTKSECTISANATAAPDGATTADKIVESTNSADHSVRNASGIATGVATCTFSVFAKAAERTQIKLTVFEGSSLATVGFDLSAGSVISGSGANIENVGNGWYRCSVTVAVSTGASVFCFAMPMSSGVSTYLGNGSSGIYVWGAQLTATAFPAPYVPTTSATVARNADSMLISGADFTDFFNPVEGTFFLDAAMPKIGFAAFPWFFAVDDIANNHRMGVFAYQATGLVDFINRVSGSIVGQATSTSALVSDQSLRSAVSYKVNEYRHSLNGAAAVTDTSGALPSTFNRLAVGTGDSVSNTRIRRLIYWPKALAAAELQRMTA